MTSFKSDEGNEEVDVEDEEVVIEEDEYEPYVHRVELLSHPTNNWETVFHLLKGSMSTGIMGMPKAFMFAGMINAIIFFPILSVISTYGVHVLVSSQYVLCKKKKVGLLLYSESVEMACNVGPKPFRKFRKTAPIVTDFFLVFYQTGICCICWVFIRNNMKYVLDVHTKEAYALHAYMLFLFVAFCLILCVRNLKLLVPFSLVGVTISFVTFTVVFYYIFANLDRNFNGQHALGYGGNFPLYFGTILFAFQSVPITLAVENNMKTPEFFQKPFGALNVGYFILAVVYFFVGILGYWRYGEEINSSITMNFPPENVFAQVIIISYCCAIYVSYGINAYVPLHIIFHTYMLPKMESYSKRNKLLMELLLRLMFAVIICVFSTAIPFLGLIISLCGAFSLSALGLIFPALLEICAYWEEGKSHPKTFTFWKDIFLIVIGVIGLFSGLYKSVHSVIDKLPRS